jgi:hypothetical protein
MLPWRMVYARVLPVLLLLGGCGAQAKTPPAYIADVKSSEVNIYCASTLASAAEVARLLSLAAAHATRSNACVDGGGERVLVDEVLTCEGRRSESEVQIEARYRVTRIEEHSAHDPEVATYEYTFAFRRSAADGPYRIVMPGVLPGIELVTPLGAEHDGECYGKIGPFVPADVSF